MPIYKEYYLAKSIDDALLTLAESPGLARIVAGGTDLILDIQQGRHSPVDTLVDITKIPELNAIEMRADHLYIGAGIPLNQIIETPLVNEHAASLIEACSLIGGPQVRNTATLGGNVAHALPAGDGTISLLSLDAKAVVESTSGTRQLRFTDLFEGPGKSTLHPRQDLLAGFLIPRHIPSSASAFQRIMRPQGVAIAILNMSVWLHRDGKRIKDVRIAVGPSGPIPKREDKTESVFKGQLYNRDLLSKGKEILLEEARFRTSRHRATMEYRQHISGVLLEKTMQIAWERAGIPV
jgi:carbon-monoxide dehydrogenase medium subunit